MPRMLRRLLGLLVLLLTGSALLVAVAPPPLPISRAASSTIVHLPDVRLRSVSVGPLKLALGAARASLRAAGDDLLLTKREALGLQATDRLVAALAAAAPPAPVYPPDYIFLPPVEWLAGDGPRMRGQHVAQTNRIDFYVGSGTLAPDEVARLATTIEWALGVTEQRFGERINGRVSLGFYRATSSTLRGIAYTDSGRAELYYLPNESTDRLVAVAAHELAHHLQAQRYGIDIQRRADTILLEGAATWIASDHWLLPTGVQSWRERARQINEAGVPLRLLSAQQYGANNAYELWASFVDYILAAYGFENYKKLYASGRGRALGSADYDGVLGRSIEELSEDWRAWVLR